MTITAAQQQDLYKLAVGLYDAAPGGPYLNLLADSLIAGASVTQLYDALANHASFQGQDPAYGDTASDAQFVSRFVEHLVGDSALQADKDAVVDYFASLLPASTHGALMHLAIDLLDAVDESDATWGQAAARLHNRIEAARYYTEDLRGDATGLSTLQGTIAAVTSDDATVTAANHANGAANLAVPGVDTGEPPPQFELPDPASETPAPGATDSADNVTGNSPPDAGGLAGTGASTDSTGELGSQEVATAVTDTGSGSLATSAGADAQAPTPTANAVAVAANFTVSVVDTGMVGIAAIIAGGKDTITGGAGNDTIEGGAGADTLDGGIAAEVREFNLDGIADAVAGQTFAFDFMSQGNLTLTEAAVADTNYTDGAGAVINGAGSDAFGTALASLLRGNLAQVNTDWLAGGGDVGSVIAGVGYSTTTNLLTFTFAAGLDVATAIDLGVTDGDAGTFGVSAQTTTAQGGTGGSDTFVIGDTDSGITLATADTITGWDATDFLALGVAGTGVNYSEAGAAVANFAAALTAANSALDTTVGYAFQFDATKGYLLEDTDLDGSANQVIVLAGIDNTEFAAGNIIA